MTKPNTQFNLDLRDIDLIENAVNSVIALRSSTIATLGERSVKENNQTTVPQELKGEVAELRNLLGRIHNQKNFYRPSDASVYVSG